MAELSRAEIRQAMKEQIQFDASHNGPPRVVHGGTLAGRIAESMQGTVEVTLRKPAPLATRIQLESEGERAFLRVQDEVIAEARNAPFSLEIPGPPTFAAAEAASRHYLGHTMHPFPTCWVCGTARSPGDGMRIFAGPISDTMVASLWTPLPSLAISEEIVRPAYLWAALDCPGGWAAVHGIRPRPVVLGRISADVRRPVHTGIPYIVTAWTIGREGRKHQVGSAIFTAGGVLCAAARATWLDVSPDAWT